MAKILLRYMGRFCELAQKPLEEREVSCKTFSELIDLLDREYPGYAAEFYNLIGERHECTLRRFEAASINPKAEEPIRDGDCYGFY